MPTAHEVAVSLRKLADSLDATPELTMPTAWVTFYCDTKELFLNAASILPRPFNKSSSLAGSKFERIRIEHKDIGAHSNASVCKSLTCEMIEPAKPAVYRCDPILSAIEEEMLNQENKA